MKKTVLLALLLVAGICAWSQEDSVKAPYLKFPSYPPVRIFLTDSSTYLTKDKLDKKTPVMIMFFDPGCEHCKHETEDIVKNMDKLSDVQIVMVSYKSLTEIKAFIQTYGLDKFKNIIVGQDFNFFLPSFFKISYFPFLAFYNKKKDLIDVFQGNMPMDKLIETAHK